MIKTIFSITAGVVLILALIKLVLVLIDLEPMDLANMSICETERLAKEEFFKGKLIDKYIDKRNHNYETIIVSFEENNYDSRIFVMDQSEAFNSLIIGDSLFKEAGSLQIMLKRANEILEIDLIYNCKD
ncbi:hypothetical protein U3A58_07215 [Algoriphagus sp. C2-6-M1]|uniref:hypothetical protein n=1 Tax=Algoriphagus persicinus TaxID=3108754 RepID=UPI002B3D0BB1|nr:hypothetical protein [Algoriphagus sp. C2-6-M1]MEB2780178.1 hypothetical protein [Algoriphagus sp. C2-6-M1]